MGAKAEVRVRICAALVLGIVIGTGFTALFAPESWDKGDVAAWVQAVGSVLAVLVAVGVAAYQNWKARTAEHRRELAEQRAILKAIATETATAWSSFFEMMGPFLYAKGSQQSVLATFEVSSEPFPIYKGVTAKIGAIENDTLRSKVVESYSTANSLLTALYINNRLLNKWYSDAEADAEKTFGPTWEKHSPRDTWLPTTELEHHGGRTRVHALRVKTAVEELLPLLDAETKRLEKLIAGRASGGQDS